MSELPEQNDGHAVSAPDAPSPEVGDHTSGAHPYLDDLPPMSQADYEAYINLVPAEVLPVRADATDAESWQDDLIMLRRVNKATKEEFYVPCPTAQQNTYLMTRYLPQLRGMFILNEFSQRRTIVRCPPWVPEGRFAPREIMDDDYTRVMMELEKEGLKPTPSRAQLAIESICHDRSFHPVRRYFNRLKWDGVARLDKWLAYYLGAEKDDPDYLAAVGRKWMIAAVARVFKPGCKFDHMLVLEGKTDIGKSRALRLLSTFNGVHYFNDSLTFDTLFDKDTILNIQGALIIEFPEMSGLTKRDSNEVKQWITIQEDRGRPPYGKAIITYPRQFVLAGTTNDEDYLIDPTGNKRFWPVMCGSNIDFAALVADREQLWAEAVHLYHAGEKWWIDDNDHALIALTRAAQSNRMSRHPWEDAVTRWLDEENKDFVTTSELLVKAIQKPLHQIKKGDDREVAGILKTNGWIPHRKGSVRGWRRP
jgi:putative DNA primase/helicase